MAKRISTLVGIIVIIITAIILLGGVFVWQYFATKPQINPNIQNLNVEIDTDGWIVDKGNEYEFLYPEKFFYFARYSTNNPGTAYSQANKDYDFSKNCPNAKDAINNLLKGEGLLDAFTYKPKESDISVDRVAKNENNLCVYRYENNNEGNFCQLFIVFIKNDKVIVLPRLINNGCVQSNVNTLQAVLSTFKFTDLNSSVGYKVYNNSQYGFEFQYPADFNGEKDVIVIGTKFYIDGKDGQSVEIFKKDADETLEAAIKRIILANYSSPDCKIEIKSLPANSYRGEYIVANISYPAPSNAQDPYWVNAPLCNQDYARTNGIRYFSYDPLIPNKFAFFDIGQYAITIDAENSVPWQNTFKFTK